MSNEAVTKIEWQPLPETTLTGEAKRAREAQYVRLKALYEELAVANSVERTARAAFEVAVPGGLGVAGLALAEVRNRIIALGQEAVRAPEWMRSLASVRWRLREVVNEYQGEFPTLRLAGGTIKGEIQNWPTVRDVREVVEVYVGPMLFSEADVSDGSDECEEPGLWRTGSGLYMGVEHWEWLARKGV